MNKVLFRKGDAVHAFLTNTRYHVFLHGANCQATMNSGIARDVRMRLPELYEKDKEYHSTITPENKLGEVTFVAYSSEDGDVPHKMAFNIYTQLNYGRDKRHFNYGAFTRGLDNVITTLKQHRYDEMDTVNIIMPRIGCGLGGGSWSVVSEILEYYPINGINIVFNVFDL